MLQRRSGCGQKLSNDIPSAARIYNVLSKTHINKMGLIQKFNGSMTEKAKETSKIMARKHFPGLIMDNTYNNQYGNNKEIILITRAGWNLSRYTTKVRKELQ